METQEFQNKVKSVIADILGCKEEEVYCVWQAKTLQHVKGLFASGADNAKGLYFEATYNGLKKELYLDHYKKIKNKVLVL
ncbi:DUF6275 family protein [Ligilactobacillus agilis]|uniref:DUF6275 family protein n=1 Tax=Ligilactobacillus agilis TaxID=1601 RepID=UPI001865F3A7|nr:DUF6275 family protein [Ligilactobacillus agilis]